MRDEDEQPRLSAGGTYFRSALYETQEAFAEAIERELATTPSRFVVEFDGEKYLITRKP